MYTYLHITRADIQNFNLVFKTNMAKKPKSKPSVFVDKSKLEAQELQDEINRKRIEDALQAQKNEEMIIVEHQVI